MKKLAGLLLLISCCIGCGSTKMNTSSDDWKSMFNGQNLKGWTTKIHHYNVNENHGNTFRAEEGIIKVRYDEYEGDYNNRFAHLNYDEPYSYFLLSMEYRFVGNMYPELLFLLKRTVE